MGEETREAEGWEVVEEVEPILLKNFSSAMAANIQLGGERGRVESIHSKY